MIHKLRRKAKRTIRRWLRNKPFIVAVAALVLCFGIIVYAGYMENRRLTVDRSTYAPLLQLIGRAESNDSYNAYFGNSRNNSIDFTKMTIREVLTWQANHIAQGNASSAVGRYQIVNTTLSGLVRQQGVAESQKFDQATQDALAIALLERRGSEQYINQEMTREQFAANLAMEWAALPKVIGEKPGDSYYAGDGLNRSRVEVEEILRAIDSLAAE